MKLGSLRAFAVVATALVVAAPTSATAQRVGARDNGLLTMMQREFEKSTEFFTQFWDSAFGASTAQEDSDDGVVVLEVVELTTVEEPLSDEEKGFACRVAVQRIDEQAALTREATRMTSRLRTPLGKLVTFHFEGETNCDDLETAALARECTRVVAMDKDIEQFLRQGKSHEAICDAIQMADDMLDIGLVDPPLSCKLCKRFVKVVSDAIKQDMAQVQQVREILGDICDAMSADSMCHTFIKHYDDIVQWLVHGTDPEVVCERLTMCLPIETDSAALAVVESMCDSDHACFYCEKLTGVVAFVVQHAPDQLDTLHTVIKYVCKLTPKDCKCEDLSTNFGKIVDWSKQGKTPEEICTALGMCKKTGHDRAVTTQTGTIISLVTPHSGDDKTCFYCVYFTTLLEIAIQEDEQDMDQIRQYADLICGFMGDNKYCHEYVSRLDTAIDAIKRGEKPRAICTDMHFCTKAEEVAQPLLPVVTGGDDKQCFYCDYVVTVLEIILQQDQAQVEQVRQYADLVCGMLGDDNVCHQYVGKLDAAIDALQQGKKPREICTQLKYCTKAQTLALPSPVIVLGDQKCFYCDYFVTILEVVIQEDKADVDQVREFADMICGMLGDDNICHQYVDKFDKAIDWLRQGKKPREVCVELKFCTKTVREVQRLKALTRAVTDEKQCLYCDYFVTIMKVLIVQDATNINMVRQYADLICGMLGDDNICHQYVDKFDVVVDGLKLGKKSHEICIDIKYCAKSQAKALALPALTPVTTQDTKTCFYCDYFMTLLQVALQEDAYDVDGVRLYAEIICGMLGDGNVCHQYVAKFNRAIEALNKGTKPRAICAEFKYCNAKQLPAVLDTPMLLKDAMVKSAVPPTVGKIDECFFCTQVANLMKVAVAQNPSKVAEIRTVADLVCKALPTGNKCHDVMRDVDQIIDSIKRGEEPAAVCRDMKFCKKVAATSPVLKATARVNDNTCAYCDGVATVLSYALKTKPDQVQQLREAAGIVCDFMPQDDKCHDDLKMFDKAVASIKSGKSPHSVCVDFNLCRQATPATTTDTKLMPSSAAKFNTLDAKALAAKAAALEPTKSLSMSCLLCEYTAEALVFIKGDTTELHLAKQALQTMCVVLPPTARCDSLSSKFDNLVELVRDGKSPSQACHTVSLCDTAFVEPPLSTKLNRIGAIVAEQ